MSEEEVDKFLSDQEISTTVFHGTTSYDERLKRSVIIPRPIQRFNQAGFAIKLQQEIERQGLDKPTAIQSQALPIILSGYDLLALAKTGSGKTFAYVWPVIVHILDQPQMEIGDGPIGLILAPTRELATQIYQETKRFGKVYNIRTCPIYGGAGKWEMTKALKEAPEIVVATPGRLIEMIRIKATNLRRCTIVVLDEADRMFEMGFEYQMRSIVNQIRPNRQMLMFSATMKKKIESFARDMLSQNNDMIRLSIGNIGQANPDIQQCVEIVSQDEMKWLWLAERIDEFAAEGKVLIFVLTKATADLLCSQLQSYLFKRQLDIGVDTLHGDKDQQERNSVMLRFAKASSPAAITAENSAASSSTSAPGKKSVIPCHILIATDIASRGLDVKDIRTVINYDVAKNIETYVHRIGRTGRMGVQGVIPGEFCPLNNPKKFRFILINLLLINHRNCFHVTHTKGFIICSRFSTKFETIFAACE
jgi:ATP-dependent RNA helicase DDX42